MIPPIESIQYLVDVFIEGGYAEDEDLDHLDAIHMWLRSEEKARDAAFKLRVQERDYPVIRNMAGEIVSHLSADFVVEPRDWESPADMPVNRGGEDGPLDDEVIPENRSTYVIVDSEGNKFFFTP